MQIHFYDQWDKQSQTRVKKNEHAPIGMIDKILSFQSKWGTHLLILLSVICALFFSYLIFGDSPGQAVGNTEAVTYVKPEEILYTVRHGDTLWSIAEVHYPEIRREEAISLIQDKNRLQGTTIHAGQTILLP